MNSRKSSPQFSMKNHWTYEPNDYQIMKIENNLGRMCEQIALDESITETYRDKLLTHGGSSTADINQVVDFGGFDREEEETKRSFKQISYLQKLQLDS